MPKEEGKSEDKSVTTMFIVGRQVEKRKRERRTKKRKEKQELRETDTLDKHSSHTTINTTERKKKGDGKIIFMHWEEIDHSRAASVYRRGSDRGKKRGVATRQLR
jgi:hypothetical protein